MRTETGTIEITLGVKKFETTYQKKIYETMEDVFKEASDGDKGAASILEKVNIAEDWKRRTAARQDFVKTGDAAIVDSFEKQVKMYMKNRANAGRPVTEEQARAKVQQMIDED